MTNNHKIFNLFSNIVVYFCLSVIISVAYATEETQEINETQKKFKLRGETSTGTRFSEVLATSDIPFNKNYKNLTKEQKRLFRTWYTGISDSEKPPFPVNGMQSIYRPIAKAHKQIAKHGILYLVATVDETGTVKEVSIYESPAEKISKVAAFVLYETEFEPATCNEKPCSMEFPFEFELPIVIRNVDRVRGAQKKYGEIETNE